MRDTKPTALLLAGMLSLASATSAQAPADPFQPVATMKQLMVEIIHPASNEILLIVNRGGPSSDHEWSAVRRSAMTLAESGNLLIIRNRAAAWVNHAKALTAAGMAAYDTTQSKNGKALGALMDRLDRSCTACHKEFRPSVFPPAR